MRKLLGSISSSPKHNYVGTTLTIAGRTVTCQKFLGEGGFAYVYIAKDIRNGQKFALKRIVCQTADAMAEAQKELDIMTEYSSHPSMVTCYGSTVKQGHIGKELLILMELCPDQLSDALNRRKQRKLPESSVLSIAAAVASSLTALHASPTPLAHRDLKAENILLAGGGLADSIRLCDFGSATSLRHPDGRALAASAATRATLERDIGRMTTPAYRAPEMCDLYSCLPITEAVDVWALGVLIYRCMYNRLPFADSTLAIINEKWEFPVEGSVAVTAAAISQGLLVDDREGSPYSDRLKGLVRACLTKDPHVRPTAVSLLATLQGWGVKGPQLTGKWAIAASTCSPAVASVSHVSTAASHVRESAPHSEEVSHTVATAQHSTALNFMSLLEWQDSPDLPPVDNPEDLPPVVSQPVDDDVDGGFVWADEGSATTQHIDVFSHFTDDVVQHQSPEEDSMWASFEPTAPTHHIHTTVGPQPSSPEVSPPPVIADPIKPIKPITPIKPADTAWMDIFFDFDQPTPSTATVGIKPTTISPSVLDAISPGVMESPQTTPPAVKQQHMPKKHTPAVRLSSVDSDMSPNPSVHSQYSSFIPSFQLPKVVRKATQGPLVRWKYCRRAVIECWPPSTLLHRYWNGLQTKCSSSSLNALLANSFATRITQQLPPVTYRGLTGLYIDERGPVADAARSLSALFPARLQLVSLGVDSNLNIDGALSAGVSLARIVRALSEYGVVLRKACTQCSPGRLHSPALVSVPLVPLLRECMAYGGVINRVLVLDHNAFNGVDMGWQDIAGYLRTAPGGSLRDEAALVVVSGVGDTLESISMSPPHPILYRAVRETPREEEGSSEL
eukprot:gnl/Dysnectes_brevis/2086_a2419_1167.p1 GENE.gnl/Dysnectes_brevis/2086_a2419_1167~~gnl/Dysnectes_brevis/2086_a2419_1167.p1  ORF type:complete len:845 (-),score=200.34 gnl/Dysnectes_brevis/2086_a2419_1167:74-2608(-)